MSRLREQKYKRWSDSNLHKTCFYCTPTSEEEETPLYPRRFSSPLLSVTQQYVPFKKLSSKYYLCNKQCDGRTKFLNFYESQNVKKLNCLKCQEADKIRGNLELYVTGTQIEEAIAEDKQTALIQHLNLSITALEALSDYAQSLQVSKLAVCRVLNISHLLLLPQHYCINSKPDIMHLTMHLQQLEIQKENKLIILQDLIEHCLKHVALPKHLNESMNNHCIRKKDFYTATRNFRNFLNNFTLTLLQMEKLHQQYRAILNNYQQSRCILNLELQKVINMHLVALCKGFETVKQFYSNEDDNNEAVLLFKSIGEKLCVKDTTTVKISHVEDSSKPKLCQNCKINHVDDK